MRMKMIPGTPVVFRVLKSGEVMALLPTMKGGIDEKCVSVKVVVTKSMMTSTDNYKSVVRHSRPAKPNETVDLLKYFNGLGLVVSVRKKWSKREERL